VPDLPSPGRFLVLKIGGSLVSDKKRGGHIDHDLVGAYAAMVADLTRVRPGRIVLVAGGGAFGHGTVRHLDPADHSAAVALTEATFQVKWAWTTALRACGVRVLPMQLAAAATLEQGRGRMQSAVLREALEHRILPVLSGDCLLTESGTLEVFGSDRVPSLVLDTVAEPVRIVMLTDVPGVLLDGPGGREVLPYIDPDRPGRLRGLLWDNGWDTSGSMGGKLRELISFAQRGAECVITRGDARAGSLRFLLDPVSAWPRHVRHTRVARPQAR
jgi:isopentenyl phosphate kinase